MDCSSASSSPWLLWQVIDSAFPIGGFAHSGGLEAAVQLGFVNDTASLQEYLYVSLTQAAQFAAPFVIAAVRDCNAFGALNEHYDTLLTNDPANRASRALGAAILAAGETIDPSGMLATVRVNVRKQQAFVHLPVAFGLLAKAVGLGDVGAADAFLFQQGRSILSSAVRLGVIGPMESQRLLAALVEHRSQWLDLAEKTRPETAVQTAPTLDILQSLHERLYSRLFNS